MATFTSEYTKLGNIWPMDYLATTPNGETRIFRLKFRNGDKLQFVNIDKNDTNSYTGKVEIETIDHHTWGQTTNEFCTIEFNGTALQLKANVCRLGGKELTWKERKEIVMKLKE